MSECTVAELGELLTQHRETVVEPDGSWCDICTVTYTCAGDYFDDPRPMIRIDFGEDEENICEACLLGLLTMMGFPVEAMYVSADN